MRHADNALRYLELFQRFFYPYVVMAENTTLKAINSIFSPCMVSGDTAVRTAFGPLAASFEYIRGLMIFNLLLR